MSLDELVDFVDSLNRVMVCNGLRIKARRDRNRVAGISMELSDGMVTVRTAELAFRLDDPEITAERIIARLKQEFLACWDAIFTKAVTPELFCHDGGPVMLTELIDGESVVRI
jgi:hypothetical protein